MNREKVIIRGSFDDLRSDQVRFLEEAARLGKVHVLIWSDRLLERMSGAAPKFSEAERLYLLNSIRYVSSTSLTDVNSDPDAVPAIDRWQPSAWVVLQSEFNENKKRSAALAGIRLEVIGNEQLRLFPPTPAAPAAADSRRPKVVVTGCYDWFHSGHVRFFEEVSQYGELYVIVGHDANIRLLKGEGHPLLPQAVRWYMVQSVRYVRQALITSGEGWMDAAPEIAAIRPDIYAVNEDGDRPEKRDFCAKHGLKYLVLQRIPKEGLPRRQSTDLRGF
jgi:cytidyltransferase-like protein